MDIVEQIGAYAGFASVVGLAVLSALYFSQARDVKRLREWAGRAPERAAEQEARIQAAAAAQQPAQQAAAAQGGGRPVPAPPSGAPGVPGKAPTPAPTPGQASAGAASPAAPAPSTQQAGATTATPPPPRPTPVPPLPSRAGASGQQTSILPPSARPRPPWYRRIHWPAPRYIALIVAGVLIVGGGAAYGVSELLKDDEPPTTPAAQSNGAADESAQGTARPAAPVDPSKVTVSVLNGTTVTGLATQVADKLEGAGFQRGNVTNFTEQARNESVVMYAAGHAREARAVGKKLKITQIERVDAETQVLAGNATVIVVVGADQTQ
jgi:LytR cell envelope-related transcriptional attenuator